MTLHFPLVALAICRLGFHHHSTTQLHYCCCLRCPQQTPPHFRIGWRFGISCLGCCPNWLPINLLGRGCLDRLEGLWVSFHGVNLGNQVIQRLLMHLLESFRWIVRKLANHMVYLVQIFRWRGPNDSKITKPTLPPSCSNALLLSKWGRFRIFGGLRLGSGALPYHFLQ